jgi:hypothetical protein
MSLVKNNHHFDRKIGLKFEMSAAEYLEFLFPYYIAFSEQSYFNSLIKSICMQANASDFFF